MTVHPPQCAFNVDLEADGRIGRVRGSPDNTYTAGVICAKVMPSGSIIPTAWPAPKRRKGER